MSIVTMGTYYKNYEIESIEQLKSIFPDGEANDLNWCVLSTSGVHGLYTTLDQLERDCASGEREYPSITVLVIMPRIVSMRWGHLNIALEDIPYLRKLVTSSLKFM
jgi:hypothetical protein